MADRDSKRLRQALTELFEDRVRFDAVERLVYSHDMGVVPEPVRKLVGCMPEAVCQPVSREEVIALAKLSRRFRVPLVPRGAATAGYGGAVPAAGGIVVDFVRMRAIRALDADARAVTVEPGLPWGALDEHLRDHGFALRTYPSSAPSATVGGWIAQGGAGYGGYEFGYCAESVVSVDLVLPDGSERTLAGRDLDLVHGMCGITGMIVAATVRVRERDDEAALLAAFENLGQACRALADLRARRVPLWSVSLTTPSFVRLKQQASGHRVLPEDRYCLSFVCPGTRRDAVEPEVRRAVEQYRGRLLEEALARTEWDERFYPLRFKKLGPTLVASEVVLPVEKLAEFVGRVEKKYRGSFALEGTLIHDDKVAVLGFMLSDERKRGFPLAYAGALSVLEIGEQLGGRAYSPGLYFAAKAKEILGGDTLGRVWAFKETADPQGLMNPGKVVPPSLDRRSPAKGLLRAMAAASAGKELIGLAGRLLDRAPESRFDSPLPQEITEDAFACALCGYCRDVCTVYDAVPWESASPRGKYFLLSQYIKGKIPLDEATARALFSCTTCKKCDFVCQIQAHNAHNWMGLRPCFHAAGLENTGLAQIRDNVLQTKNFWGVPPEQKYAWLDVPTRTKGKVGYWAGCWANIVMPNMAQNATRILHKAGVEFVHLGEKETCCGLYLALGGYAEDFAKFVGDNLRSLHEAGVETLVLSCPGCYATFSENYPAVAEQLGIPCAIRFRHLSTYLAELAQEGRLPFEKDLGCTVTYHDSCHVGRWFGHYEEPRRVLAALPGVRLTEMPHNRQDSLCCGLVAAFDSLPTVAHSGQKRVAEAEATGADYLVTNCAGCGSQFNAVSQALGSRIRQRSLTDLVAEALGLPPQDPSETVGAFMGAAVELLQESRVEKARR
ncbi:MAG: FAD-binding and (Fe-S)-binding domain-containing protein [Deferrisomatales bacterium]